MTHVWIVLLATLAVPKWRAMEFDPPSRCEVVYDYRGCYIGVLRDGAGVEVSVFFKKDRQCFTIPKNGQKRNDCPFVHDLFATQCLAAAEHLPVEVKALFRGQYGLGTKAAASEPPD